MAALPTEIIESLTQMRESLEHRSISPPTQLRDSLTYFGNELQKTPARQQRLIKRNRSGVLGSPVVRCQRSRNYVARMTSRISGTIYDRRFCYAIKDLSFSVQQERN
ncbi:hypothetical protein FRC03_002714 [Tulasnella sp. 419]|nr:hypothetical protein FRC03_002714 [Tulasnella sp. 419]